MLINPAVKYHISNLLSIRKISQKFHSLLPGREGNSHVTSGLISGFQINNTLKQLAFLLYLWSISTALATAAPSVDTLPSPVQLVGQKDPVATSGLTHNRPILLLACSHATASLLKEVPAAWLERGWTIPANRFIGIASVSKAPWLVKKLFIGSGLEKLVTERREEVSKQIPDIDTSPVIVDMDGEMASSLKLNDMGKNGYVAFIIDSAGSIHQLVNAVLEDDSEQAINTAASKIVQLAESQMQIKQ